MAGNTRDLSLALQGAEAGLRYGEQVLAAYTARPTETGTLPCTVCQTGTLPVAIYDPSQFNWSSNAQTYGNASLNLAASPQYTTEVVGFVPDSLNSGQEVPDGRVFYQLTSRSTGASGLANTVLQSTYVRRF
jgi:type IV pilus assembly protein PilX